MFILALHESPSKYNITVIGHRPQSRRESPLVVILCTINKWALKQLASKWHQIKAAGLLSVVSGIDLSVMFW